MNSITINNRSFDVTEIPEDTPLLWVLRDYLDLTGTKYGCGVGQCGSCTILLEGKAVRSCQMPLSKASGKRITTIENEEDREINLLRKYWQEEDVAQCGYCQPGQLINAAGLLKSNNTPGREEIMQAMEGNICRCGTYNRIETAISKAVEELS